MCIRDSLQAQWFAMYAADLTNALLADEDPHPGAFAALGSLLKGLAVPGNLALALLRFQWALLVDVGYRPELQQDVEKGVALPKAKAYSFDPKLGGLTMRNGMHDETWRVRSNTVELLRAIASGETVLEQDREVAVRANRLLCTYFRSLIDKQLPTMDFILSNSPNAIGISGKAFS